MIESRRKFVAAVAAGAGAALANAVAGAAEKRAEVNATEDLMREHGVLRRVLLIYDACISRLQGHAAPPPEIIAGAAGIVQRFIEGYHEKLEEQFVFPKLKQGKLGELVQVLLAQHQAGRKLTAEILEAAKPGNFSRRQELSQNLAAFARMYRPHAAREDTDLFPAFHALFTEKEFDALGDRFEEQEHKLLGGQGFEGAVQEVADLERALGLYDLAQFTPR